MISAAQIRAARAMLQWSIPELAERSGVHRNTVSRIENNKPATRETLAAIRAALEAAGMDFVPPERGGPGVRCRQPPEG